MKIYKQEVTIPKNSIYENLEGLTGKECYDRYGLKRDECVSLSVTFPNGYKADIKMCICDEEYLTFSEMILFNEKGHEICFTEPADSVVGEWYLEDLDDNIYQVEVIVEE